MASFQVGLGIFGTVLAVVVSPMFIVYGDRYSFLNMAIVIGIIGIALVLLQIYGIREDKSMIESYYEKYDRTGKSMTNSLTESNENQTGINKIDDEWHKGLLKVKYWMRNWQ